jgi:clan AA aspartic protease
MMIAAEYDTRGSIIVDVTLIGKCGQRKQKVLLDTGFSGSIAIPVSIGCEIGLETLGNGRVILASGEGVSVPLFAGKLRIGADEKDCVYLILMGATEVLLGMDIIKDYNVQFHGAKRTIQINRIEETEAIEKAEEIVEAIMPIQKIEEVVIPERKSRMEILKQTLREVVPR